MTRPASAPPEWATSSSPSTSSPSSPHSRTSRCRLVSGFPEKEARTKALEALSLVGLSDRTGHYPAQMSGGQQQRVTIARALVNQPEIVWADEPTGNLDTENAGEVMDLLIRLNKELDETFVIVTQTRWRRCRTAPFA